MWPALLLVAASAGDEPNASLELRVNRAVARALAWLGKEQKPDGTFTPHGDHPGGATALGGLAFVSSGVPRDDPRLIGCIEATSRVEWRTTYSAAVNLLFLDALRAADKSAAPPPAARACLDFLLANQREGQWGYPHDPIDLSNTQYALLGLRAAHRLGLEVPERAVEKSAAALVRVQHESGGFSYTPDRPPTFGLTTAALAGVAVLKELGKGSRDVESVLAKNARELQRAEAWVERHFDVTRNAYGETLWTPTFRHASAWALERWCGLTGRDKVGEHDWYREGAEWLLSTQKKDGEFGEGFDETCYSLLFLRRATVTGWSDLGSLYRSIDAAAVASASQPDPKPEASVARASEALVAGPWRDEPECAKLFAPPFAPERVDVKPGAKVDGKPLERVALKSDGWTDLEAAAKSGCDACYWLVGAWIHVAGDPKSEPVPLRLWLALEDPWRVFVGGREVASGKRAQGPIDEHARVDLDLVPGWHPLVVLVADLRGVSAFSMRVTDREGRASAGVRIATERPPTTKGRR